MRYFQLVISRNCNFEYVYLLRIYKSVLLICMYIDYKINVQIVNMSCKKFLKIRKISHALFELYFFNIKLKFFTRNKNSYSNLYLYYILFMKI